ncbi:hypothetical protein HK405_013145, partial [Cladochytrium tenue]
STQGSASGELVAGLCAADGYDAAVCERVHMAINLSDVPQGDDADGDSGWADFLPDIRIAPLDTGDAEQLRAVFELISLAYAGRAQFEAWLVAWRDNGEPVCVVCVERLADGEGGGEPEPARMFATQARLTNSSDSGVGGWAPGVAEPQPAAAEQDFAERKRRVEE